VTLVQVGKWEEKWGGHEEEEEEVKKGQTPRQEFKQGRVVLLDPIDPVTVSSASRHSILASFSQFLRIARYVQRCPESTYKSNRFLCTESRSFESTRRCDCTQLDRIKQSKSIVCSLRSSRRPSSGSTR